MPKLTNTTQQNGLNSITTKQLLDITTAYSGKSRSSRTSTSPLALPLPALQSFSKTTRQPAQDRLKRLQCGLKKIDNTQHSVQTHKSATSGSSHRNHKRLPNEVTASYSNAFTSPETRKCYSSTTSSSEVMKLPRIPKISAPTVSAKSNCKPVSAPTKDSATSASQSKSTSVFSRIRDCYKSLIASGTAPPSSETTEASQTDPSPQKYARSRLTLAKTKLRNAWEKPKALAVAINKLNNKSTTPKKRVNIASERLKLLRETLQEPQHQQQQQDNIQYNNNNNENSKEGKLAVVAAAPTEDAVDTSEPMDWQPIDVMSATAATSNAVVDNITADGDSDLHKLHSNAAATSANANKGKATTVTPMQRISKRNMHDPLPALPTADEQQRGIKKAVKQHQNCLYFVLDTNVLLNYFVFVEELTKIKFNDNTGHMLFIPYIVIRELDRLKEKRDNETIRIKAVRAICYLNTKFDESNDIQAQSALDEMDYLIDVSAPDDEIINCCLQLQKRKKQLLLVTDDGNLRLKAKANGITATTKSDLVTKYADKFDNVAVQ